MTIKTSLPTGLAITLISLFSFSTMARDFLIVGQPYPPFFSEDKKQFEGGMADAMKEVCTELKYNCKFEVVVQARALKMLEDGDTDAVLNLISIPEREVYAHFAPPMIASNIVYMAHPNKKMPKMTSTKDLAGWTVVAVRKSASLMIAKKHQAEVKTITINEVTDNETLVEKLLNDQDGPKTLVIGSEDVLNYLADKKRIKLDAILNADEQQFTIGLSKKKVPAAEAELIDKAISKLKANGVLKKAFERYQLRAAK